MLAPLPIVFEKVRVFNELTIIDWKCSCKLYTDELLASDLPKWASSVLIHRREVDYEPLIPHAPKWPQVSVFYSLLTQFSMEKVFSAAEADIWLLGNLNYI